MNILACLVATLGGLLFGYDTGVISGAIEPLTVHFALSDAMKGWVSGCVLLGCAAGVLLAGSLADRWGRKAAMGLAAVMFVVSAAGAALSSSIAVLVLFRLLGGVGIGLASVSTPMYIAEIAPADLRGRLVAVNQIAIVGGIVLTSVLNYFIARSGTESWLIETGWRWMFGLGVVPAAIFAVALTPIPESPRWLSLAREQGTWRELWSPALRGPLIIGITLAILQQITGINVFLYFGATIFKGLSAATGVDAGLLQQIVINGACVCFTVIAIATVDRWGRRPLMLIGAAGMGASLLAMGGMAQSQSASGGAMLGCIVLYIACFGLSVGPVTWVILSEIFPTAVRGRALGLATFFLWLADYGVTQSFPMMDAKNSWLVTHFHHAFPFYLYAVCCVVLILVVWRAVPETKGRTLESIAMNWKHDSEGHA